MNPTYDPLPNMPSVCNNPILDYTCVTGGEQQAVNYNYSFYASSGGFSNYTLAPDYQKKAISGYFQQSVLMPPTSYYNANGKGFPDISAFGTHGYEVINGIDDNNGGGTSMSTPILAGIMGIVNSYSISLSGKPLGFISPLLYKIWEDDPSAFYDITVGDSFCTRDGCNPNCKGFYAAPGWDPGKSITNYALTQIIL
jgi:subtilase family serine protease